jgi:hypothetical protein
MTGDSRIEVDVGDVATDRRRKRLGRLMLAGHTVIRRDGPPSSRNNVELDF